MLEQDKIIPAEQKENDHEQLTAMLDDWLETEKNQEMFLTPDSELAEFIEPINQDATEQHTVHEDFVNPTQQPQQQLTTKNSVSESAPVSAPSTIPQTVNLSENNLNDADQNKSSKTDKQSLWSKKFGFKSKQPVVEAKETKTGFLKKSFGFKKTPEPELNSVEVANETKLIQDDQKTETNLINDPELQSPQAVLDKPEKRKKRERALQAHNQKKKQKQAFKALPKEDKKKLKNAIKEIEKLNKPHKGDKTIPLHNPENIIELSKVVKYYTNGFVATKILKEVNLEIRKGDFVIILGPSGSGKTTLMNILSGLDRASDGITNVNGTNLITLNDHELTKFRKDNVGYVFQQYGLLPNLTVRENVEMGADLQSDKSKKQDVVKILESVGMGEHLNKFPHQLSGGQQQRVSIARAFAKNPTILFGDEPTGAIDEEMSKMVLKEFVNINVNYGTTVIIVTHNPIFEYLGNLVIKIKDGQISHLIRNDHPKTVDELPWGQT